MEKGKVSYLWLIPLILLFPVLQSIIFFLRFGRLPLDLVSDSFIFAPMGLISGLLLVYLLRTDENQGRKKRAIIGFIISIFIAIPVSIMSGLLVTPIIASAIFGSAPLVLGILIGYGTKSK